MKPWPKLPLTIGEGVHGACIDHVNYERARYEAAMERLRVAVEALEVAYGYWAHYQEPLDKGAENTHEILFKALEAIGELPDVREG